MKCFVTFTAFALFFGAEEMTQQFIDGGHDAYFCRRTTPVVRSVTRIWQCSHRRHVMCSLPHLSVQFITVLFIPLERSIARINEAAVRRGVWKFSYLNERFHDCVDRQIVGGREQMRTDKESTQVSDILCWKGRRFPAGTVGSEAQHTSPLVDVGVRLWAPYASCLRPRLTLTKLDESLMAKGQHQAVPSVRFVGIFSLWDNNFLHMIMECKIIKSTGMYQ